ncbi:MAG: OsmC family protein [Bacteroidetes bacterium]|jgi:uncharacterized OsmC-like protein|nr:OsmC family protein [Bacteroidota bacterium]
MTSQIIYHGELRNTLTHLASGQSFITDAPVDNRGKGEAFSPTDLTATSLGACMLTVMGIKAADMAIDISGTIVDIQKMMAAEPRRISGIKVVVNFPDRYFDDKTRKILEHTALTCPVAKSLHPDILQDIHFIWSDSPSI